MKVLTVDDNPTIRVIVKRFLEPLGLTVLEAGDGKEAVTFIFQERPNLVILDVNMPLLDGVQVLELIRKHPQTADLPVLMLTADSGEGLVMSLIRAGITDYIVKPFNRKVLLEKVQKILGLGGHDQSDQEDSKVDSEEPALEETKPQARILLLDSDETTLRTAATFLKDSAQVLTAWDSEQAVQMARENPPHIVCIGLGMEGADATEVFKEMLMLDELSSARFVAMAMRNMTEEIATARRAGFHGILLKPFDQQTLNRLVDQQNGWLVNLLR